LAWTTEKERSTKIDEKTVHENFHLKKIVTHSLVPNLLPSIITATPPTFTWNERDSLFLRDHHHQASHLYHWCRCTTIFNKHFLKLFLKDNSAIIGAVPEQKGLRVRAAFISAHFKLHQGIGDTAQKVI